MTNPSSLTLTITDDDAEPSLSIGAASVTEGDSGSANLTFTVTLDAASGKQVTVAYADAGTGTATSGTDYTAIPGGTLTFATGDTSKTITVPVRGDTTDEPDETVLVSLSGATNATIGTATGTGTITDDDDTPTVTLALSRSSIAESGTTNSATVTASLDHPSSERTTITVSAAAGANTVSGDFTLNASPTLTIAAGSTSSTGTVTITAVDNDEDEVDKSVTVSGTAANGRAVTNPSNLTLTITDDDAEPSLSIGSASVTEGDTGSVNLTFTVTLDAASGKQVTVAYADAGTGTATSGTDYTAIPGGTLTFAAGDTSKTITVSVTGDTTDEPDETVLVSLSGATNAGVGAATGTGTITDDDDTPSLSIGSASVTEGDSGSANLTFTVSLDAASGKQVTVAYADAGTGTATSGVDYTSIPSGTLTFGIGDTSKTITVSVRGDTTDEPDETVLVSLSGATNATIATATGTGTITDDDAAPSLSIGSPSVTEGDSSTANLTFTVTLSESVTQEVTVDYAEGTGGTATAGTDYTAPGSGTLTFPAGDTSKTITVSVTGDATDEPNETVVMTLSGAVNATIGTATGTGTITDDDVPSLSIGSPSVTEGDTGAANLTFTVTLSQASWRQVTVDYADAGTGTATSGADYTAITGGTLTFGVGDTSKTITVSVTGDTADEPNETVLVSLSGATNATIGTATGTGTITDDDVPSLSIGSASVTEGNTGSANLTFTVTMDRASWRQVTVGYADAGTGTATSGTDYTAITSGTLTFGVGETSKTITVSVRGDTAIEPNETVLVTLSGATNATIGTATGTGTITNDDSPSLSIDSPSVAEGDSSTTDLTFTVTLSESVTQEVTVDYAEGTGGTATAGTDYTAPGSGTLTFSAGDTSQTITVSVTGDTTDEPNETVVMTLNGAVNATIGTATGTGTITDDDEPSLSIDSPSVTEGNTGSANLTFTVTLDQSSWRQVTVQYADAGTGTATSATDYTAITGGTLTFGVGDTSKTITVSVTGDTADEPNETVSVSLSGATNAVIGTAAGAGTITDDDVPSLSIDSPRVAEGNTGSANLTFTVTMDRASWRQVTVGYADAGTGTATSATDYTAITGGTLTFGIGDTSKTITVSVRGDTAIESNETVLVTLSGATNAVIGTATGTGTIDNDDSPSLSIDSPSVTEGDSGAANLTFTVTLSESVTQEVTVAYAEGTGGTATAGTDYTAPGSGTLTFSAGDTSKTITVSVTGDTTDEPNETVVLTLSGAVNATIGTATGTGTITDDDVPSLSISSPSVAEGNTGSANLTFTVTMARASWRQVTVTYADAGTGTAASGTDYTAIAGGTLTFGIGDTSKTITVSVTGDTTDEPDETVLVTLSGATNAGIGTATGTGTITDDDGEPSLSISSPSVAEGNTGSANLTFTVSLSPASGKQVTVAYADAGTGTATSGTDYTALAGGTLTFAAGDTSQEITVSVTGDTTDEENETVQVTLSGAVNATIGTATGTGAISDDDGEPSLSIGAASVAEGDRGAANLTFTVSLSPASGRQVTVDYAEKTGGTATSGTDYTALPSGTLTFAAGDTSQTITVSVAGDETDEPDETVLVELSGATNATISTDTGTGTITDDDDEPSLSIDSPGITEGNTGSANLAFTVSLSPASGKQVTVGYADAGTGTATSGTDYTAIPSGTLTFAAGDTSKTITVSVTGDTTDEEDETVLVELSGATNAGVETATGTGTITDDDAEPSLSIGTASVAEGDSGAANLTFTVTLSPASGRQVTVNYAGKAGGTATGGADYTALPAGTLTFEAGDTSKEVTISVTGDETDEPDETVLVELSGATNASVGTATGTGTITDDDDAPTVTLALSRSSITEGGTTNAATVTASLDHPSSERTTITVAAAAGTDTVAGDYTLSASPTLTLSAGSTTSTGTVTITAVDNDTDEPDKSVTVSGTAANSQGITQPSEVTLTITDDDAEPSLAISSPSVDEGGAGAVNLTFTVSLSPASGKPVTVDYADAGTGTATSGTDYTALAPGTLTFATGETSQAVTVSVIGDTTDEPDETVRVTLSDATNAGIGTATGTGTIRNDDFPASTAGSEPTLSIDSPSVSEGGRLIFTVSLAPPASNRVTVDFAVLETGSASRNDFTGPQTGTLAFEAGDESRTIEFATTEDSEVEEDEEVLVRLGNAANAALGADTGVGTIRDDDDDGEEPEVEEPKDPRPVFRERISDQKYRAGSAITPTTLPEAVGGNAPLAYSLTPEPPAGLVLDIEGRILSGTPTTPQSALEYRWTATDEDGDSTTRTFAITVLADSRPAFDRTGLGEFRYRVGRAIPPERLPSAAGGDGRLTYALSPGLPDGLAFDSRTMMMTGMPVEERERTIHTLAATDEDGDSASVSFALTTVSVPELVRLRIVSSPEDDDTYYYGEVIEVEAEFSEPPAIPGTASVALTIGSSTRSAWLAESNGAVLGFRYAVRETDRDRNGVSIGTNALSFRGADAAAAASDLLPDLSHPALADQPGHRVDGSPQTAGTLPALRLALGAEPARVDLREAFHAAVTYAAVSSAPEVAAAAIDDRAVVVSAVGEGTATVTVTGRNAGGSAEQRFEVVVFTAAAELQALEHGLAGYGRSLLTSASATVGRRLRGGGGGVPAGGEGEGDEAGDRSVLLSGAPTDDRLRLEEALAAPRAFSLSTTGEGSRWTLWGAGDLLSIEGVATPGSTWTGRPTNSWLGVDVARGRLLAGFALSRSAASLDYAFADPASGAAGTGRLETQLFSVHPYLRWSANPRTEIWAHGGLGRGSATLTRSVAAGPEEADLDLALGLAGLRRELGNPGGTSVALRADFGRARLGVTDGTTVLRDLSTAVYRGRLGFEATRRLGPAAPFLAVGGRYDGGAGASGAGLEVAGGLRLADAGGRFGLDASGRWLAVHTASGYRESGVALTARFTPSGGERGLVLEAQPSWGAPAQGAHTFWNDRDLASLRPLTTTGGAMAARVAYGFRLMTPFTEFTWSDALSRLLRAGVRVGRYGEPIHLELAGTRQESGGARPRYRLDLLGRLRIR